jgi:branched-chain amino acid transport system substrate-binding protein
MNRSTRASKKWGWLVWLFLLVAGLALSGCQGQAAIRVGFVGELTGLQSDLGVHERNGVQLAVDEVNTRGGVAGRDIELIVRDDQGTPQGAQAADRELVDAGVVAIIGHATSGQTVAGLPVTTEAGVVLLSPSATTPDLSGLDDLFFRVIPTHLDQAQILARHARENRGIARVAIIFDTDNAAYSQSYQATFAETFRELGGQVTDVVNYSSAAKLDFEPLVLQLQAGQPEGLLIVASALDTALIAQQTRLLGWEPTLFASAWAQTDVLIQNGGQAVEGLETVIVFDVQSQAPAYRDFRARYQARFGYPPTFAAGEAYEAMMVLAAALEKTGGRAEGLPQALSEIRNFQGLIGELSLDEYGDASRTHFLIAVREGQFVTLK